MDIDLICWRRCRPFSTVVGGRDTDKSSEGWGPAKFVVGWSKVEVKSRWEESSVETQVGAAQQQAETKGCARLACRVDGRTDWTARVETKRRAFLSLFFSLVDAKTCFESLVPTTLTFVGV